MTVRYCNIDRFDNDERHVTAFRPISEAARSWSYDNNQNAVWCHHILKCSVNINVNVNVYQKFLDAARIAELLRSPRKRSRVTELC